MEPVVTLVVLGAGIVVAVLGVTSWLVPDQRIRRAIRRTPRLRLTTSPTLPLMISDYADTKR